MSCVVIKSKKYQTRKGLPYFMLDKEALPNEALDLKSDAYPQFYKLQFSGKPIKTKKN